jgi:YVTN family beta-propeller protein
MSRRARRSAVLAVVLLGLGVFVASWADRHVARVRGPGGERVSCFACHFVSSPTARWERERPRYPSPSDLALAPGGERLFVVAQGTDEVLEVDLAALAVTRRLAVGRRPHGIAVSPDGARLYVALRGEDRVAVLETATGREVAGVGVGLRPCGIALSPDGATLIVANSGSDDVSLVDTATMAECKRLAAGREPYDVACAPDGALAWVANRMSSQGGPRVPAQAELTAVDLGRGRVVERRELASAHLSEGVAVSRSGAALVSLVRARNVVPIVQVAQGWVVNSALGLALPGDRGVLQLPLDEVNAYFADPSGVAVDDRGGRAYVAAGGADCVSVVDLRRVEELVAEGSTAGAGPFADDLGASAQYVVGRVPTGPNPRELALSPDGARLYVCERLSDSIAVVDTGTLEVVGRVDLGGPEELTIERRGERVFHRAAITFQGQFSCRSCHPDGHVDGLVYDFAIDGVGRNLLDNRSLLGIADTAPFKWNGKNKSLHEQCGPRFAKVLTMADPFPDEQLDELVAYIESLPPPRRPAGEPGAVARGRVLFERTVDRSGEPIEPGKRCTTCHNGPFFTDRLVSSVVTQGPTDSSDEFDTPHLVGIADSAPYLHDGRAPTLEEIWTVHSPDDTHGRVNDLNKAQLNDLIEYLRTL